MLVYFYFFLQNKSFPFFGGVPTILDEDGKEKEGVEVDQGYLVRRINFEISRFQIKVQ